MKKKVLALLMTATIIISSTTVFCAEGKYSIDYKSGMGEVIENIITLEGTYDITDDTITEEFLVEEGSKLTINTEIKDLTITDGEVSSYDDNYCVYSIHGKSNDSVCKVRNVYKETYEEYEGFSVNYWRSGITIEFIRPGRYYVEILAFDSKSKEITSSFVGHIFEVVKKGQIAEMNAPTVAKYTKSSVLVNGNPVAFEAYNIDGNNYFKLRDLAMALNGTEKQFEVSWNAETSSIVISPNKPYTVVGGELAKGDSKDKTCREFDGRLLYTNYVYDTNAYNINGNNYFKLRDICKALDVEVTWDAVSNTIGINTANPYKD